MPLSAAVLWIDALLEPYPLGEAMFAAVMLYLALGWQSLLQHAQAVQHALENDTIGAAREAVQRMVSRDASEADAEGIAGAAVESVLENGADAIFSALFWYLLAGAPGVVAYRLCNTLDAMWGYRNPRFLRFGCWAARVDDLLNLVPARLTALSYALAGSTLSALRCWKAQGGGWKSPNAGPVMAAGAGAMEVTLGGRACYQGQWQQRPLLGVTASMASRPSADTIAGACALVNRALLIWVLVILLGVLFSGVNLG